MWHQTVFSVTKTFPKMASILCQKWLRIFWRLKVPHLYGYPKSFSSKWPQKMNLSFIIIFFTWQKIGRGTTPLRKTSVIVSSSSSYRFFAQPANYFEHGWGGEGGATQIIAIINNFVSTVVIFFYIFFIFLFLLRGLHSIPHDLQTL